MGIVGDFCLVRFCLPRPCQPIRDVCSANLEHPLRTTPSSNPANQFLLNSFLSRDWMQLIFRIWRRLRLGLAKCIEDLLSCCKLGSILTSSYCYLPYYRELMPGCKNASDGSSTDRRTTHKMGDKDGREKFDGFFSFGSCSSCPLASGAPSLPLLCHHHSACRWYLERTRNES